MKRINDANQKRNIELHKTFKCARSIDLNCLTTNYCSFLSGFLDSFSIVSFSLSHFSLLSRASNKLLHLEDVEYWKISAWRLKETCIQNFRFSGYRCILVKRLTVLKLINISSKIFSFSMKIRQSAEEGKNFRKSCDYPLGVFLLTVVIIQLNEEFAGDKISQNPGYTTRQKDKLDNSY